MISCSRCQCCQRSLPHLRAGLTSWSPCSPPRSTPRQVHLQVIHRTCILLALDKHRMELGSNDFTTILALTLNANLSSCHSMSHCSISFHFSQPGVQFSSRQQPPHPTIVGTGQAQTPGHHQPVFGASPMGLLPAGGVRGGGGGQGEQVGAAGQLAHLTGEKKPPLLSHKLSGAEMTAVRQLITGYRFLENKSLSLFNLTPHFPGNRRLFF